MTWKYRSDKSFLSLSCFRPWYVLPADNESKTRIQGWDFLKEDVLIAIAFSLCTDGQITFHLGNTIQNYSETCLIHIQQWFLCGGFETCLTHVAVISVWYSLLSWCINIFWKWVTLGIARDYSSLCRGVSEARVSWA